jgi:hypothetical protein
LLLLLFCYLCFLALALPFLVFRHVGALRREGAWTRDLV